MKTVLEQATIRNVHERLKDKEWFNLLYTTSSRLNDGYYPQYLVDVILQKYDEYYTVYDAYAFLLTWSELCVGDIVCAQIYIDESPHRDCHIQENNDVLKRLTPPFYGEFWGGLADCDGRFGWASPIYLNSVNAERPISETTVSVADLPLEVGTTAAWNTWSHIVESQGVARWPYDANYIYVLYRRNFGVLRNHIFNDEVENAA